MNNVLRCLNKIVQRKHWMFPWLGKIWGHCVPSSGSLYEYAKASDAQIWVKLMNVWSRKLEPKQLVTLHPSSLFKNLVSDWKWMWFFFITIDKNPNISPSCHHCLIIINAISLLHYLYVLLKNVSCGGRKNFFGIHANLLRSWAQYSVICREGRRKLWLFEHVVVWYQLLNSECNSYQFMGFKGFSCQGEGWADFHVHMNA